MIENRLERILPIDNFYAIDINIGKYGKYGVIDDQDLTTVD